MLATGNACSSGFGAAENRLVELDRRHRNNDDASNYDLYLVREVPVSACVEIFKSTKVKELDFIFISLFIKRLYFMIILFTIYFSLEQLL